VAAGGGGGGADGSGAATAGGVGVGADDGTGADTTRMMRESAAIIHAEGGWTRIYTSSSEAVAVYERTSRIRIGETAGGTKPRP